VGNNDLSHESHDDLGGPGLTDTQLDIATTPRRIFTLDEANGLLPQIDAIFREMDSKSVRARELGDLVGDLESYWGKLVEDQQNPEYEAYARMREDLSSSLQGLNDCAIRLNALGCELKDPNRGLVDFYGYVNGDLVYLCWQRGEHEIGFWHTLEAGFPGRKPIVH